MPAKRKPKKSRPSAPKPSLLEVTPPDLDTIAVAPVSLPAGSTPPQAPKSGPPQRGAAFAAGSSRPAAQSRQYAFRRS
ncbi:hypothetical protein GA0074692_6628 [Micromonospora pallida]|uniref:Uncharacterized protein n=1 Tax=Micromonospora pallida TaxID=145854 RepID=A0A1C6TJW6_9ACTN|nr:hypothetical protein [Micromonospora pallida]SCL42048.1 hypothetical protein GA0074692_6628 [Micromonospora pallida]